MKRPLGLHLAVEQTKQKCDSKHQRKRRNLKGFSSERLAAAGFTSLRRLTGQAVLDTEDPGFLHSSISSAYIPSCAVGLAKEAPLADQSALGIQPPYLPSEEDVKTSPHFIPLSLTTNHYLGGVIV